METLDKCGPYIINKTIGKGGYAYVKLAQHEETKKTCALKIMKRDKKSSIIQEVYENEVSIMMELCHSSIIKMNDFSSKDRYISSRGNILDVFYIAMEYAEKGELFDLILSVGKFTEQTARFLFTKILDGVSYLHNKGTSHLDIKLENILVDEEFNTKISDFGLSTSKQEIDYKAGTDIYWAPEMFTNTNFKTKPLDVFALGVVLFSMVSGKPPFTYARVDDRCFQLLNTNSKQFWKQQSKSCNVDYSSEFIELINSIFELDPAKRATIKDIKESEWLNGYLPSKDEVAKELTITRIKIKC